MLRDNEMVFWNEFAPEQVGQMRRIAFRVSVDPRSRPQLEVDLVDDNAGSITGSRSAKTACTGQLGR